MAKHKGDMLEALRATLRNAREEADQAATPLPVPRPGEVSAAAPGGDPGRPAGAGDAADGSGTAGAPVASPAAPRRPERPVQRELEELDRRIAEARAERPRTALLALQGLALVVAFLLGRFTASGPVQAESGSPEGAGDLDLEPSAGAAPTGERPSGAAADGGTPLAGAPRRTSRELLEEVPGSALLEAGPDPKVDDRAFQDPANTHTVKVIEYVDSANNLDRAFRVYDDLRLSGLPAVTPLRYRGSLIVFVGAAPGADLLAGLLERVRRSPDPDGREGAYASAYVVPLEPYRSR